jgi:hypothetical protein
MVEQVRDELGNRWVPLFKLAIGMASFGMPFIISLMVWQTSQIFELRKNEAVAQERWESFVAQGPRYTQRDAEADKAKLRAEFAEKLRAWSEQASLVYIRKSDR